MSQSSTLRNSSSYVWMYFAIPTIVWGGSFQMIKWGLVAFTSYQLASVRLVSAGFFLLFFLPSQLKKMSLAQIKWCIVAGLIGSFFPAYLFSIAETSIDGTTAGILNSTTPVWALIIGLLFFRHPLRTKQLFGILFGFVSVLLIILSEQQLKASSVPHALLVVIATLMYAFSVWIVDAKLTNVSTLNIASVGLTVNVLPAAIIFLVTDYETSFMHHDILTSLGAGLFLGVFASCLMGFFLYQLIKKSSAVFASMTTYAVPVVAVLVGWIFSNERITTWQLVGLFGVLCSVYLSQKE